MSESEDRASELALQTAYKLLERLEESNARYQELVVTLSDVVFEHDTNGLSFLNTAWFELVGEDLAASLHRPLADFIAHHDVELWQRWLVATLQSPGQPLRQELRLLNKGSQQVWVEIHGSYKASTQTHSGVIRDITLRKGTELALKDSERAYRHHSEILEYQVEERDLRLLAATDTFRLRFFWKDRESRYLGCNELFAHDAGFVKPEDVIGKVDDELAWASHADRYRQDDLRVIETGHPKMAYEEPLAQSHGLSHWILTSKMPTKNAQGEITGVLGMYQDISTLKESEDSRTKLKRAYQLMVDSNQRIVQAEEEQDLLEEICRLVVDNGYRMSWVGVPENDEQCSVRVTANAGFTGTYLQSARICWADQVCGRGPAGTAIREARTVVIPNVQTDPGMRFWRDAALQHGYKSCISLPLFESAAGVMAVLSIYAAETNAFDDGEVQLLKELAKTLSFGILAIRERAKRREILEATVGAIATTIESRDPYTAGHQRRVAQLAAKIAAEMQLPSDDIRGIHFAGMVHDVGKVYVPSEFLTKPVQLTEAEFAVIKTHPEIGFLILQNIPFPWPVAEMVRQHHEHLDGSGYPRGLKGENILLGARILTVADIVEAMATKRPYRSERTLDDALNEILNKRGITLDPQVVDTCVRLFREKNLQLEDLG
jgi:PAS domain S-box-containing protein